MSWLIIIICAVASYLLGSLNGGIMVTQLLNNADIRESGSGNAGFTNVKRVYGAKSAAIVCAVDIVKTVIACGAGGFVISHFTESSYIAGALLCGLFAQIGHIFPLYYGFKGGKGFICGMTTIFMADPLILLGAFVVLTVVTLTSKYVSLGSLCATLSYAIMFVIFHNEDTAAYLIAIALAVVVFISHRANIKRLLTKTESKTYFFGMDKKKKEEQK
ncbi:MAG: glycerol-3-phosphate 1-O-acyltransferase PlsY [Clostridia bacterium]|nr:glycerol-3-phosphate 1-O-acyltransferase PlsY [Clostridia bacterium]